jgi:transposase
MARKPSRAAGRRTHSQATTTPRVRRAIQASEEKNVVLAKRYGVNRKTIAKWKARASVSDERMGPKNPRSSVLTRDDEAIILAYRWRTRLRLNDCHDRLSRLMPKLSRSALYRCLKRRGLNRIGKTATSPRLTSSALRGPYTFEITANEVVFLDNVRGVVFPVFLAVEEITKHVYAEVVDIAPENAAAFLTHLVAEFPQRINAVTTDIHPAFTDWPGMFGEDMAPVSPHPFAVACRANRMVHTRTPYLKPPEPKIGFRSVEIREVGGGQVGEPKRMMNGREKWGP